MIKAKKKFGQNFLKDDYIKNKIIESMPCDERAIVEIGPGLGDLTKKLLINSNNLIAYEVDLEICEYLQKIFETEITDEKFELICCDVLKKWDENSLYEQEYNLIANLPYYIATNIILRALSDEKCKNILVMVQKEVAEKFAAIVKDKNFSSLSILANSIGTTELLFDVGPESFDPPPKVTSSVLKIAKYKEYVKTNSEGIFDSSEDFKKFSSFLKSSFKSPRKTLIKNLSSDFDKKNLLKVFETLKIVPNTRPHELTTSNYHLLYKLLNK